MISYTSSSLHPSSSSSPAARSRTFPLLSRFLFYMIEDTFLLFRALFYVIEDVLFPCSTFYFTSKTVIACVYVCIRVVGYCLLVSCFFLFSGKGYTVSLVTQAKQPSTFLWLLHPIAFFRYCPTLHRSRSFFVDSLVVSLRRSSLPSLTVRVALTSYTFVS